MALVVLKGSVKLPRAKRGELGTQLRLGEAVPDGALPPEEIARLTGAGILGEPAPAAPPAPPLPPRKGPFCHDPKDLVGRTVEQLRILVQEAGHPDLSGADLLGLEEGDLVNILTADFEQVFTTQPPVATDRSRQPSEKLRIARRAAAGGE